MNIYIDIDRGEPVIGQDNHLSAPLPPLIQGDTLPLRIFLLESFDGNQYSFIPVAGTTLEVALGIKRGTTGGSYYTQQFSWTPSGDLAQPYFEADFPMNTSGVDTLLGSKPSNTAFFEVKKVTGGIGKTVLSKKVTVQATVIHDGMLTVPEGLTPISAEAVNAGFIPRTGFNGELQIINPITGKGFAIYADADGAYQIKSITPP